MSTSKGQVPSADALRVFISSRMDELAAERAAAHTALTKAGCAPWLFEVDAGARPGSARNTYLQTLHVCDLYLGLFWKTRGQYTVDEFDEARRCGIACLIYEKQADDRDPELSSFLQEIGDVEEGVTVRRFRDAEELEPLVIADVEAIQDELLRVRGPAGRTYTASPCGGRFDRTAAATPIRRHPLHETDGPPPPEPFVDRRAQVGRLRQSIADGTRLVGVTGDPGLGKSATLRFLAHDPRVGIEEYPDGVGIYLEAGPWPRAGDLMRAIWAALFRVADRGYVPDDVELRADLNSKRALVFVDDVSLRSDEVDRVHADMPDSTLIMAAPGDTGSLDYAQSIPLQGFLDPADIIELFSACCGQAIPDDLAGRVVEVCRRAGASPGAITRIACDAWGSGLSIADWIASQTAPEPVADILERALDAEGRKLLAILAAFGPDVATPSEVVARLGVSDERARELVAAGHAYENSPDLRLAGEDFASIRSIMDVEDLCPLVFEEAVRWADEADDRRVRRTLPFLLHMIEWGTEHRRYGDVLTLAHIVSPHLALNGAWESWGTVTGHARAAASAVGDRSGEAWALHEEGTRQMMLGDDRQARRLLHASRKIRRRLGERAVAVTSHNLSHLPALPLIWRPMWMTVTAIAIVAAVVFGVVAVSGLTGNGSPREPAVVTTLSRPEAPGGPSPVTPLPEDRPPEAGDDFFEVVEGGTVRLDLLRNDSDPDGQSIRVIEVGEPAFGGVYWDEDGWLYYEHWEFGVDQDRFTYSIANEDGETATATVTISILGGEVVPVSGPLEAGDDFFEVVEGGTVRLDLLRNDSDPDGQSIRVIEVGEPAFGGVYWDEDGWLYYEHWEFGVDQDRFTYSIANEDGETATATVTISIIAPNRPPEAESQVITAGCGPEVIVLRGFDWEGAYLAFEIVVHPAQGPVTLLEQLSSTERKARYEPDVGEGTYDDRFVFEVSDGADFARGEITIVGMCIR